MNDLKKFNLVRQNVPFWKVTIFILIAIIFSSVLSVRLIYIQGFNSSYYKDLSNNNTKREISVICPRGTIYDRNGLKLAEDIPTFDLYIIPKLIQDKKNLIEILPKIAKIDLNKLKQISSLELSSEEEFLLKGNLTSEEVARINELLFKLQGVSLRESYKRYYPYGETLAHILGYTGIISSEEVDEYKDYNSNERVGKSGIERSYEEILHGEKGKIIQIINANNKVLNEFEEKPVKKGDDIYLTIDLGLQRKIESAIKDNYGTGIIIDIKKGEILACASNPSFNPNIFSDYISEEEWNRLNNKRAFFNIPIQGTYPPGSTFKPLISLFALNNKIINLDTSFLCSGSMDVKGMEGKYRCWVYPSSHGWLKLKDALKYSCDIFFYQLARECKIDDFLEFAINFGGLTSRTEVDVPFEETGFLGSPSWKNKYLGDEWFDGDSMNLGIGQGYVLVTPIQMANLYCKFANNGKPTTPHFLMKTEGGKLFYDLNKIDKKDPIENTKNIEIIREYLKGVTQPGGTAPGLIIDGIPVAAKTGTAEGPNGEHLWLISIYPADDPQIVALIMFENSKMEYASELTPYLKEILTYYQNEYNSNARQ